MQDTRANSECSSCFKIASGGQVWSIRCRWCWRNVKGVYWHEGAQSQEPLCIRLLSQPHWNFLHVDYMSIEMTMKLQQSTKGHEYSCHSRTTSWNILWPMLALVPVRLLRLLPSFLYQGYILSLWSSHQASKWSGTWTSRVILFRSCVSSWGLRRLGLCSTMLRPMGRWKMHTSNYYVDGWKTWQRSEGRLAQSLVRVGASLQLYKNGCD